jgi:hypothetical protein
MLKLVHFYQPRSIKISSDSKWTTPTPQPSSPHVVTLNHLMLLSRTVQVNILCVTGAWSTVLTQICFVHQQAVQFNREDFHCGNVCKEETVWKCHSKLWIRFPGVSVPSKSSMPVSWRSFTTPTLTCTELYYIYYMMKYKAVKFAMHLCSVCNWSPST